MSFIYSSRPRIAHTLTHLVTDYWREPESTTDTSAIHFQVQKCFSMAVDRLFTIKTHISDKEFDSSDLTCCLTPEQRAAINGVGYSMDDLLDVISSLQSHAEIVRRMAAQEDFPKWIDLALIAYIKTRQVSAAQITSLCLRYGAMNQCMFYRCVNILYPGNPPSISVFSVPPSVPLPEMRTYCIDENPKYIQSFFNFSDQQMEQFLKRLKHKPLSEKYYTTIGLPVGPVSLFSQGHQRLMDAWDFFKPVEEGVYPFFKDSKHTVMVVPSFSMLDACVRQHFPVDAVPMMPLLGRCRKEEITKYTLQGRCVLHVGTSRARVPFEADNIFYGEFSYSLHDVSHRLRKAMMGAAGQRAVCYLVGCVFAKNGGAATEKILWKLIDGELHTRFEPFGTLFYSPNVPWDALHIAQVVKNMAAIPDFWEDDFGITAKQLRPSERQLYDVLLTKMTEEERAQAKRDAFQYFRNFTHPTNRACNFRLASMYFDGYGTDRSYALALTHFERAGKLGYYMAAIQYRDGLGCERNPRQALYYSELAAKNGSRSAAFQLGIWHFYGYEDVVGQNYVKALHYFERAAAKKDRVALRNLGVMYMRGYGIEKCSKKAYAYFKEAAELGDSDAQRELGFWSMLGKEEAGIAKDEKLGLSYFFKSAEQGNAAAYLQLGIAFRDGTGCEKHMQTAFMYFFTAAALGDEDAQNELGTWYFNGVEGVVTRDLSQAEFYLNLAAQQGNQKAKDNLKILQSSR